MILYKNARKGKEVEESLFLIGCKDLFEHVAVRGKWRRGCDWSERMKFIITVKKILTVESGIK